MSRRIRLIVAYDGTNYVGWQLQDNGVSVQQRLNEAALAITGEHIQLHGSGRTDSGVHARAQVAHFDTNARMPADKFAIALNMRLPRDIRVLYSEEAPEEFHARFSAKNKTYRYTVQLGLHADVFARTTSLHVHTPINLERMQLSAKDALGEHDFSAFMSVGSKLTNTVRTITKSEWTQNGKFLTYEVSANGFLYNMVRILVGTMLEIGSGKLPQGAIARAIVSGKRDDAGGTAPPHGLFLQRVQYDDFDTDEVLSRT
ncbi:MAG: tRNA pseudouridine(38-40) synthase TruA [Firmicutes bacterium HGW-Firmicutes-9]|jgi:tRNA pseudouridine38-40 synthase|nr:MAG: tRNA pseudouridine(38-40) synthase TruA [Firmicutes bacterium HGW-Firmicutes-9]